MKVVINNVSLGEHFGYPGTVRVGHVNGDGFNPLSFTANAIIKGLQRIAAFAFSNIKNRSGV